VDKIEGSRLFFFIIGRNSNHLSNGARSNGSSSTTFEAIVETPVNDNKLLSAINFATFDYLSSASSRTLQNVAKHSLAHYSCGSCGPHGFYDIIDAHLKVEEAVSSFLRTDAAILYSDGASASTSTVAAFAKHGNLLVVDEGIYEALLVGVTLSCANVQYFRQNNVKDLR